MRFGKAVALVLFATMLHLLASTAGAEVFLRGNYIEVGVHNSGSFGTSTAAPAGFHPFSILGGRLGFVADPAKNGWTVGAPPATGDYFVTGAPEEGWSVQWQGAGGASYLFHNYGLMGQFQVPMTSLAETSSGDTKSALWVGGVSAGGGTLKITQNASFNVNDLFFTMNVVFTNTGSTTLSSLKYMRNVDPDQESGVVSGSLYGTATTRNWVSAQPPRLGIPGKMDLAARPAGNTSKALVLARGLNWGYTLGLGAIDNRAVVATQGFSNRNIDSILTAPSQPTAAVPVVNDQAIVLLYDLGDLAPGQSKTVTYAYILDESDLERALGNLAAVTILQPTGTVSGSSVLFQATTDKLAETTLMEFYVNGSKTGSDTTPNAGGVFESAFDSTLLANGTVTLKVVATFANGTTVEKTSIVTVDNAGPPISFIAPLPGGVFSGTGIAVQLATDSSHPPVRVSFFRESGGTSLFIGEDTSAPFTASFGVTDLAEGATVVIKAVAADSLGRATTVAVSGTSYRNAAPTARPGASQNVECSGSLTPVILDGTGSSDPDSDPLVFSWSGPFGTANGSPVAVSLPRGIHTIDLTVSDGKATDTASTTITVVDTVAPIAYAGAPVTLEATGTDGAPYLVPATASDACGLGSMLVVPSLSVFPLGTTTVTVTALDLAGHATAATTTVTVVDTIAPLVTPPANVAVEANGPMTSVAIGTATAVDVVGVVSLVGNAPASFPVGTTMVTWTATDAAGNQGSATQSVTVTDTTAPVITAPATVTVEATGTATSVELSATAVDTVGVVSFTSNAPATFPVGMTTVTWTATDAAGNRATATQAVTVKDTTPPKVTAPANITIEATGSMTSVTLGTASAVDAVGVVSLTSNAPAVFPLGTTTVVWKATDGAGNSATATQTVTVVDTKAPLFAPLATVTREATSPAGAVASFSALATDLADPAPVVSCLPASGSLFPLGITTVTCRAKDATGNVSQASFVVRVQDTTPPKLTVPAPVTVPVNTTMSDPVVVAFLAGAIATDLVDTSVTISTNFSGSLNSVGTKTVVFTATDDSGNSTTATAYLKVVYTFGGFLAPVSLEKPFKLGSTVPVKFQLTDKNGALVSSASARLSLQKFNSGIPTGEPLEVFVKNGADAGNLFRYSDNQYIYNLPTESLSLGLWQIQVQLDDGTVRSAWLTIK